MGHTNSTANYNLPQFVGSDKPTWLGDVNGAMSAIDAAIANAASAATDAASVATNAATVAAGAVTTANAASETATAASTAASGATTTANNAAETANNAQSTAVSAYNKAATIGDVAELTTTDKTSAVAAINEVNAGKADAATIGDLTDLDTTDKSSVVAAINEVVAELPSAGGSVSVTADGVKTTAALLTELFALVDATKLTPKSAINVDGTYLQINAAGASLRFSGYSLSAASHTYFYGVTMGATSSMLRGDLTSTPAYTVTDTSTSVPANGAVFELFY